MKNLVRLLKYIRNYKGYAGLNVLFNLLTSVFNIFSLAMVIPILELLFTKNNSDYEQVLAMGQPELGFSGQQVMAYFNYYFSQVILDPARGKAYALIGVCILAIIVFFLKNLSRYLALYFAAPMRNGIMRDVRQNIYDKILRLPMTYFTEEKKGDIMSRISHGAQEIEWTVLCSLEMILRDPVTLVIFLVGLIGISPSLTLYIFIFLPVAGFLIGRVGKSLKKSSEKGQGKMGDMLSLVEETIGGIKVIQAFVNEKMFRGRFQAENGAYRNIMTRLYRKQDLASPMSEFLGVTVMCIIIYYGGSMIIESADLPIQQREMDGNLFVLFILLFSQMIQPAKSLTTAWYNVQRGAAAEQRINEILNADEPIRQPVNAVAVKGFETAVTYSQVHFEYIPGEPVLKGVDLTIEKGQMVALVGPSGSGKSTLADLLPRFYDPTGGSILIDGHDIRNLDLYGLRGLIGVVSQQSILFNDSVFNNIAFGFEGVTQEMVEEAAKVANAHDFIKAMPNGYQSNIGEGGDKLSGGQKQRLSIARAVLANPPILILDEATSALDTESERLVQDALFNLMKNRTSLVIAHRLSTIQAADKIIVMEKGQIVEQGTHEQLIAQQGLYAKLSTLQSF